MQTNRDICKKKMLCRRERWSYCNYRGTSLYVKKGATLVEMCIAMALVAVIITVTVSFSAMLGRFIERNQSQYNFLKESSDIKTTITDLISSRDTNDTVCTVSSRKLEIGTLCALFSESESSFIIQDGNIVIEKEVYLTVTDVKFMLHEIGAKSVLKCTVTGSDRHGADFSQSFLVTFQCGSFV